MKTLLTSVLILCLGVLHAQTVVREQLPVSGQRSLNLDFAFADEIELINWDKDEVLVEVEVEINDGEDDELFMLQKRSTETNLYFEMDRDTFEKNHTNRKRNCWNMEINYKVYFPSSLELSAETISGNYTLVYYGKTVYFKTISGDIDLTVPEGSGMDFKVKTISGEVYSDMNIQYPDGKEGLRQIVGMKVRGRVYDGGEFLDLETISGNIFLRKG